MPKKAAKKNDDSSSEEQDKKKKRKRKDPNAPKRPANPYLLFSKDHRDEAQKKNPDLKGVQLTAVLSQMWNDADEKTKQKYKDMQNDLAEKYKEELEDYKANKPESDDEEEQDKKKKKKKAKKDPNAPKKPLSSYMIFCAENRDQAKLKNPDKKLTELSKVLGDQWKALSDKEKKKYQDKADTAKAAYEVEMKAYNGKKKAASSDDESE